LIAQRFSAEKLSPSLEKAQLSAAAMSAIPTSINSFCYTFIAVSFSTEASHARVIKLLHFPQSTEEENPISSHYRQ
jgi:hypothetical protein